MSAKYIFVTGGVVSSLGKGLAAASLGCLLESRGLRVNLMKFDPYLNVDPGTMSPFQHGEVFVTDDGAETDLDLGLLEIFVRFAWESDDNVGRQADWSSRRLNPRNPFQVPFPRVFSLHPMQHSRRPALHRQMDMIA